MVQINRDIFVNINEIQVALLEEIREENPRVEWNEREIEEPQRPYSLFNDRILDITFIALNALPLVAWYFGEDRASMLRPLAMITGFTVYGMELIVVVTANYDRIIHFVD